MLGRVFHLWTRGLISFGRDDFVDVLRSIGPFDLLVQIRAAQIGFLLYWFSTALRRRSLAWFRDAARALNILAEPAALPLCARQRMQGKFAELTQGRAQHDTSKTRPHSPSS